MSPYVKILYHIVFSTKNRRPFPDKERREDLYRYMRGVIKNKDRRLFRINGAEEHIHILSSLHPSIALADFIKDIKVGPTGWIKRDNVFPGFDHWREGYGAFTVSPDKKQAVIEYIKAREHHHGKVSFLGELKRLLNEAGIEYDERCFGRRRHPF